MVSATITIEPRLIEKLLDVLARLDLPINPQLYHDAATISLHADGTKIVQPTTLVEFPAWAGRLGQVKMACSAPGSTRNA